LNPKILLCTSSAFLSPAVAFFFASNVLIPILSFSNSFKSLGLTLSRTVCSQWFPGKSGGELFYDNPPPQFF
jgi:hypothetical protein